MGSISGSGRSPGGGNGNPLQDSCLENLRTEEPDGLQSIVSQRVDMTEETEHFYQPENQAGILVFHI